MISDIEARWGEMMEILKEVQYNPNYCLVMLQCKVGELDALQTFINEMKEKKNPEEKILSIFAVERISSLEKAG